MSNENEAPVYKFQYNGQTHELNGVTSETTDADILSLLVQEGFPELDGGSIRRMEDNVLTASPAASKNG